MHQRHDDKSKGTDYRSERKTTEPPTAFVSSPVLLMFWFIIRPHVVHEFCPQLRSLGSNGKTPSRSLLPPQITLKWISADEHNRWDRIDSDLFLHFKLTDLLERTKTTTLSFTQSLSVASPDRRWRGTAKPVTTVQDCISRCVTKTPLDIFNNALEQVTLLFVLTENCNFWQVCGNPKHFFFFFFSEHDLCVMWWSTQNWKRNLQKIKVAYF